MTTLRLVLACTLLAGCDSNGDGTVDAEEDAFADADGQPVETDVHSPDGDSPLEADVALPDDAVLPEDVVLPDEVGADDGAEPDEGGGPRCDPADLVAAVSSERLLAVVEELAGLSERASRSGQLRAAELLAGRLEAAGVPYRTLDYEWGGGGTYRNIEVELPGRDLATEIHAAGAHYDAVWGSPGADDNAAGAAAIVELATVMAGCSYRRTVRLLLLSNEEAGTVGSSVYAQDAAARGDDIRAFLSLDMIAYGPPGEDLDVVTRPPYSWLAERVVDASLTEAGFPAVARIHEACGCGDEGPFWSEGYSAVFLIEDYIHGAANPTGNPHYESPTDTPDTLNLELGTGITRAAAAALAVLADE